MGRSFFIVEILNQEKGAVEMFDGGGEEKGERRGDVAWLVEICCCKLRNRGSFDEYPKSPPRFVILLRLFLYRGCAAVVGRDKNRLRRPMRSHGWRVIRPNSKINQSPSCPPPPLFYGIDVPSTTSICYRSAMTSCLNRRIVVAVLFFWSN